MSVTNVLLGLQMATAFRSWLPSPARFGEISKMLVLREESFGFDQKFRLCEKGAGIV